MREHTRLPLIAKIEKPQAVERAEEIVHAADCVMVARGDLGIELRIQEVPIVQKQIIALAGGWPGPSITATQMLDSMVASSRPTRAEVTDVANAILDGTDALMLSQETAVGQYPVETVAMMASIAEHDRAERSPTRSGTRSACAASRAATGSRLHGGLQRVRGRPPARAGRARHPHAVGPLGADGVGAPPAGPDLRAVARQGDGPPLRPHVGCAGRADAPPRGDRGAHRRRRRAGRRARLGASRASTSASRPACRAGGPAPRACSRSSAREDGAARGSTLRRVRLTPAG